MRVVTDLIPPISRETSSAALRYFWERPHEYEGKIVHVGTPGIFHRRNPDAPGATYCGRPITDARSTNHKLLDYSPCVVCFAKKEPRHRGR